ncbi:MAG: methyltransferase domain-containing protein [Bacteroidetes bacterium]|nr:MAG: methyltransferase domain-containing protein [Bacteroidota bacterium]
MEAQLLQIREQQKEMWNRFSPGWKKWDDLSMDFLKPMADEIIQLLKPKDTDLVLDVASGTGEPGLTIATMLRGGKVIATDLAEGMLEVAKENAVRRGIKNFDIVACDVCELPFPDNSFDAISCRLGFMFFPDMLLAAREMVRVLKPGGRIAATVWDGPERNLWASSIMGIINKNMQLIPPPPGAPGLFRCAKSGFIADLFKQTGLKNISESEVRGKLNIGNRKVYWNFMTEVVAPVVAALSKADCEMKVKIRSEVFDSIRQNYSDGKLAIDSNAFVIYGEK